VSLITLEQAKKHLRIDTPTTPTPDPGDADILMKMAAAEAVVFDYLEVTDGSPLPWTEAQTTVVRAVVLMLVNELYRFRGDDPGTIVNSPARDPASSLSPMMEGMLRRLKPLALA